MWDEDIYDRLSYYIEEKKVKISNSNTKKKDRNYRITCNKEESHARNERRAHSGGI